MTIAAATGYPLVNPPVPPPSVSLSNKTVSASHHFTATAFYVIQNSGTVTNGTNVLEAWLHSGSASDYEVRATLTYGEMPDNGNVGVWYPCSSTQTWSLTNNNANNSTLTTLMLVELRLASSGVVQASATIRLNATSLS